MTQTHTPTRTRCYYERVADEHYTRISCCCKATEFAARLLDPTGSDLRIEFDGFDGGAYSVEQAKAAQAVIGAAIAKATKPSQ